MDDKMDALSFQSRRPFIRLPLLFKCMGFVLDNGDVYVFGTNGIHSICGSINHTQAIEFLTFNFQLSQG
jgi:hypothetical protein